MRVLYLTQLSVNCANLTFQLIVFVWSIYYLQLSTKNNQVYRYDYRDCNFGKGYFAFFFLNFLTSCSGVVLILIQLTKLAHAQPNPARQNDQHTTKSFIDVKLVLVLLYGLVILSSSALISQDLLFADNYDDYCWAYIKQNAVQMTFSLFASAATAIALGLHVRTYSYLQSLNHVDVQATEAPTQPFIIAQNAGGQQRVEYGNTPQQVRQQQQQQHTTDQFLPQVQLQQFGQQKPAAAQNPYLTPQPQGSQPVPVQAQQHQQYVPPSQQFGAQQQQQF